MNKDDTLRLIACVGEWGQSDQAIRSLADLGEEGIECLVDVLLKVDLDLSWRAAEALGEMRETKAVEPLLSTLEQTGDGYLRAASALALGRIGDTRAVESLIRCSQEPDRMLRWRVVVALGRIGDERGRAVVLKATEDDADTVVKEAAAAALRDFGQGFQSKIL